MPVQLKTMVGLAGSCQDQLCSPGSQRPQLPWLQKVCEAICAGKPTEWLHGKRHHSDTVYHRAGCILWRSLVRPQAAWIIPKDFCYIGGFFLHECVCCDVCCDAAILLLLHHTFQTESITAHCTAAHWWYMWLA